MSANIMKTLNKKFMLAQAMIAAGFAAFIKSAKATPPPSGQIQTGAEQTDITSIEAVQAVVTHIVGWTQVFFYIIATLFILFAAFRYLTSGGEEEKIKGAKNMLIYSIVAIAVAAVSGGVILAVRSFLRIGTI